MPPVRSRQPGVRDATDADLDRINEIYNWTIVDNHVSFDTEPFDLDRRRRWWAARDPALTCLVAELDDRVVGVSYSSWYRPKSAYRCSMETTIVLDVDVRGHGLGTLLLGGLLDRLVEQNVHTAVAIVALPNPASMALHRSLGFVVGGTLPEIGWKNGRYWDTALLYRTLDR